MSKRRKNKKGKQQIRQEALVESGVQPRGPIESNTDGVKEDTKDILDEVLSGDVKDETTDSLELEDELEELTMDTSDDLDERLEGDDTSKKNDSRDSYEITDDELSLDEGITETDGSPKKQGSSLTLIVVVILILLAAFLIVREIGGEKNGGVNSEMAMYTNDVAGYEFKYPGSFEIVAHDRISEELKAEGVTSLEDIGLSKGDVLLIKETTNPEDSIVYSIVTLSNQPSFESVESYVGTLNDTVMMINDSEVGVQENIVTVGENGIDAQQFSFVMDVPVGKETRTGEFFDTVFAYNDNVYSVSFGYPVDMIEKDVYVDAYTDILDSITFIEIEDADEGVGDADVTE